jgi:protein phosphatase
VLIKSIGTKRRLSDGYVQNLKQTTPELSMQLAHQDILLLCSDGVWDLVSKNELEEIFTIDHDQNLQTSVNLTINKVLERGASDNATLLALQFLVNT